MPDNAHQMEPKRIIAEQAVQHHIVQLHQRAILPFVGLCKHRYQVFHPKTTLRKYVHHHPLVIPRIQETVRENRRIAKRYQSIKKQEPQQEFKVNHIVLFFHFSPFYKLNEQPGKNTELNATFLPIKANEKISTSKKSAITRISTRVIALMRCVTLNYGDYFAVYDFLVMTLPSKSRTIKFIRSPSVSTETTLLFEFTNTGNLMPALGSSYLFR